MIIGIVLAAALVAIGIWQRGIVFGVGTLGVIIAVILFLLWQRGRLRREPKEKIDGTKPLTEEKKKSKQAWTIGILITGGIILMFWPQLTNILLKDFWSGPVILLIAAILIASLCIAGNPVPFIKKSHSLARFLLWCIVLGFLVWPAVKYASPSLRPGMEKVENFFFASSTPPEENRINKKRPSAPLRLRIPKEPRQERPALRFPTPGDSERYIIGYREEIKGTLNKPAPRWAKWVYIEGYEDKKGQWHRTGQWKEFPWPPGQTSFKLENDQKGKTFEVCLELPGEMISVKFPLDVDLEGRRIIRKPLTKWQ